jgi:hypothetical protein
MITEKFGKCFVKKVDSTIDKEIKPWIDDS